MQIIGGGTAINHCNEIMNSDEIEEKSLRLKNYLQTLRFHYGDYGMIYSENSPEYLILILAMWKISVTPILVNSKLSNPELKYIFDIIMPRLIFTDKEIIPGIVPELTVKISELKYPVINPGASESAGFDSKLILFTSGSSGKPKGVVHSFKNIYNSSMNIKQVEDYNSSDIFLLSLPLYHIGGLMIFFRSYFSNGQVVIPKSLNTDDLIFELNNKKITILSLVPTQLKRIVDKKIIAPKTLRAVYIGGAASDKRLIEEALDLGWKIKKVYGSTETCSMVSVMDADKNKNKISSSGLPIPNNIIRIYKENGTECFKNQIGQIGVSGNSIFEKYFNDDITTAKKIKGGMFMTGDYGYIDDEGFLFVTGRIKNTIISGGENINPIEIEIAIRELDGVSDAFVFGKSDEEWGEMVCAAIETWKDYSEKEIKQLLRNIIAPFKIPKKIKILKAFPRNTVGKVEMKMLKELFKD